jgi:hypothetical protein
MAQTSDGGGGSGNTEGICSLSGADEAQTLGNIITAVKNIQIVLAQLCGTDISAIQSGDITNDGGGIDYGTDTWVTEYGTIANPDPATIAAILENAKNGQMVIGPGKAFNVGAGVTSFLVVQAASTALSTSGLNATADLSTVLWSRGSAFTTGHLTTSTIDIVESGYYHISVVMLVGVRTDAGSTWMEVLVRDSANATVKSVQDLYGQHIAPNSSNQTLKLDFSFSAFAGYDVIIKFNSTTGSLFSIASSIVSIEKLRSI